MPYSSYGTDLTLNILSHLSLCPVNNDKGLRGRKKFLKGTSANMILPFVVLPFVGGGFIASKKNADYGFFQTFEV